MTVFRRAVEAAEKLLARVQSHIVVQKGSNARKGPPPPPRFSSIFLAPKPWCTMYTYDSGFLDWERDLRFGWNKLRLLYATLSGFRCVSRCLDRIKGFPPFFLCS
ncbi:hypothetical protein LY78DRAFT_107399 [Colletotrichum sublineola]|nr:hypothetical protein LY78DRAFT_107399 [Colletotrichum sublineola]